MNIMIRYTIPSSEEDRTATYLIETAVHTAKGQAQGIVFFFNSVVTHVCSFILICGCYLGERFFVRPCWFRLSLFLVVVVTVVTLEKYLCKLLACGW